MTTSSYSYQPIGERHVAPSGAPANTYAPNTLRQYAGTMVRRAENLVQRATWRAAIIGAVLGGVATYLIIELTYLSFTRLLPFTFYDEGFWWFVNLATGAAIVGGVAGYIARMRAQAAVLVLLAQAQQILCWVQFEENTAKLLEATRPEKKNV